MFTTTISIITLAITLPVILAANCPNIVTRNEWEARSATSPSLSVNPPTHVVIHHSASSGCTTKSKCSRLVKSFQNYHMDTQHWNDIGYSFLVGEDGNVYEGVGWGKRGTHAPNYNSKSIGICVIGTFTSTRPNDAALQAVKDLIACGVSQGKIKRDYKLIAHRQVKSTECPGKSLYDEVKTWPQWTSQP
ncbi:hypothetical protein ILUMI_13382 [Ignelater luminosus]|uniref:Peptidoglycan-recognition protein n=1 Tax=Ignelater luminosus TaxID=2038154 RepID=A0A8K0CSI3_IGNLU|nr:hypothetical protein ILUMI_13382 [Ignelater luminosus]